jgi:hypothetical protein
LENTPWAALGWNTLLMAVKSIWSVVNFNPDVGWFFSLDSLFLKWGVEDNHYYCIWTYPDLLYPVVLSYGIGCTDIQYTCITIVTSSWWILPFCNMYWLFISSNLGLKSTLSNMNIAFPTCFFSSCLVYHFTYFYFQSVCVFAQWGESLVNNSWILLFNLISHSSSFN